ncbi:MAG: orotidine-5'-phosphate decarboxylase [Desulfobacteraceae bacterium]|nr:orotidine-5'-phosphate decarboxylase [Desulfobacteraceae bacterium]
MKKSGKDYIVFPLDFASIKEAQSHVRLLGPHVGMFKIGLELFIHQGPEVVRMIRNMSAARIFLDLKLHDISTTVFRAMSRVADLGVDLATVHCSSSVKMLEMAVQGACKKVGVLGVTLLTDNDGKTLSKGGFQKQFATDPEKLVMLRAQMAHDAGCTGVVCSGREAAGIKTRFGKKFLTVTPGIRPAWSLTKEDDQKRITTPAQAVLQGSDLLVIGRPIRDAQDPAAAAQKVAAEIETALARSLPA